MSMYIDMFKVGLKKDDVDRNDPEDCKKITRFRQRPQWLDGDDPFDRHSQPIMIRVFEDVFNQLPFDMESWFNYQTVVPFPPEYKKSFQNALIIDHRYFMQPDDLGWTAKLKHRSEKLAYPDRQYAQVSRGHLMWMFEIWGREELQERADFRDFFVPERQFYKKLYYQSRNFDRLQRYTKDEHDYKLMDEQNQNPIDMYHFMNDHTGEFDCLLYANNEMNRKMPKYVLSATHFWQDQACKYQWKPEEDPNGDVERCLEILPPDDIGTMCIVREYYEDIYHKVGPILRALNKAGQDGYEMIVVDPFYFCHTVGNWIHIGGIYQGFVTFLTSYSIFYCVRFPGWVHTWGVSGWLAIILYCTYKISWENDPVNNYDFISYFEGEMLAVYFPQMLHWNVGDFKKRVENFRRFNSASLLNRNCMILKRRRFPFNTGMKKFLMRCQTLLCFGLMVWRTGWPPRHPCLVPCNLIPWIDKDGTMASVKWKWIPMPRLVESRDAVPVKGLGLYDKLVYGWENGWIFGFATLGLIWYNWVKKPRLLDTRYRRHVLDMHEPPPFRDHYPLPAEEE